MDRLKESYWKNRNAGKRGQGVYPTAIVRQTAPNKVKQGRVRSRGYLRDASHPKELVLQLLEQGEI